MRGRIKVENFYKTSLQTTILPGSPGDSTEKYFVVGQEPQNDSGWVVVDLLDTAKRDIIFYHRKSGATLYYYDYNRSNPSAQHNEGALVQINDVAQMFNRVMEQISDFGIIEHVGTGLDIKVYGGKINIGQEVVEVPDALLTVPDNATKYVIIDNNNQFVLADAPGALNVGIITSSGGTVTSIQQNIERGLLLIDGNYTSGTVPVYNSTNKHFSLEPKPSPSVYVTDYNGTTATVAHNMDTQDISAFIVSGGDVYIPSVNIIDNNNVQVSTSYSITGKLILYGGLGVSRITDNGSELLEYVQSTPATTWTITHNNSNKLADVTIRDTQNNMLIGDVRVINQNTLEIGFSQAVAGTAYLLFKKI